MSPGSNRRVATAIIGSIFALRAVAASAACPGADMQPQQISVSDYATSLLCTVNETRRTYGRGDLVLQGKLIRAASAYAPELVAEQFFAHTSPDGRTFADRLAAVGFIPRSTRWLWAAGENLAAGEASEGTPAAIVQGWLQSPDHRVNLLDPDFRLAGIGVARGWPAAGSDDPGNAVTVVLDLGYRRIRAYAARRRAAYASSALR